MIGKRIKYERLRAELTRKGLAEISGLHEKTIWYMEADNRALTSENLYKLAVALSIPESLLSKPISNEEEEFIANFKWRTHETKKVSQGFLIGA